MHVGLFLCCSGTTLLFFFGLLTVCNGGVSTITGLQHPYTLLPGFFLGDLKSSDLGTLFALLQCCLLADLRGL